MRSFPPFKFHKQKEVLEAIKLSPEIWGKNKTGHVQTQASSVPEGGSRLECALKCIAFSKASRYKAGATIPGRRLQLEACRPH